MTPTEPLGLRNLDSENCFIVSGAASGEMIHPTTNEVHLAVMWWLADTAEPDDSQLGALVFGSVATAEIVARGLLEMVEQHRRANPPPQE